jgi:very-short-patch-repair endonuclease
MRTHAIDELPLVFRGRDAVAHGALTPAQLRGPAVRRVVHGVYTRSRTPLTHRLKVEAVSLLLPPGAVITGRSAATVRGAELARWDDDVEVLVAEGARRPLPRGTRVRRTVHAQPDAEPWSTSALASPVRMGFDLAVGHDLPTAVGHLDAVARRGLLDPDELRSWAAGIHHRGAAAVRAAAALLDPRAESQPESVLRVHLVSAGLDVVPQVAVRDADGFVARADLAVRGVRVAVQYDGGWHALREQLERDRRQLQRLRDAGWEVVHVTAEMLRRPDEVVAAVDRAVRRQRATAR